MKLLQDRYGDPVVMQRVHINQLVYLSPVYSEKNVTRLRNLHDQIEVHYRGLEALGGDQITYSSIVVPTLLEKLPEGVRFNMIRSMQKKTNQLGT